MAWQARVADVQQEPLLFHDTTRENLRWAAPDSHDAARVEALELASAGFARVIAESQPARVQPAGIANLQQMNTILATSSE